MVKRSTLFLALTRPALSWGVPVEAFWGNVLGTFYLGAFLQAPTWWRQPIMFWLLGIPFHIILRELTALDYHWARTIRLQLETAFIWVLSSMPRDDEIPTSV
jgi:type IV secretory pathway VirB3-like protein